MHNTRAPQDEGGTYYNTSPHFCSIVRNAWSSALDPRISAADKSRGVTAHSKVIIEACRPFAWMEQFPPTSALSLTEARAIEQKWGEVLK